MPADHALWENNLPCFAEWSALRSEEALIFPSAIALFSNPKAWQSNRLSNQEEYVINTSGRNTIQHAINYVKRNFEIPDSQEEVHPSIFRDLIDCYSLFLAFRHYQHDFEIPDSQEEVHPSIFRDLIDCYSIFLAFRHYQHDFDVYFPKKAMLAKFAFLSSLAAQCNHFFTRDVTDKFEKLNQFFVCLLSHSRNLGPTGSDLSLTRGLRITD